MSVKVFTLTHTNPVPAGDAVTDPAACSAFRGGCWGLYDKGRPALRKHYGTGGGAGLEHCVEFGYDQHTGRLAEVTHGGAGLPEAEFDYTYIQNSHLPKKLVSPVHTAERVYESYRDALKSMVNEDKAGTPNNLATVTYGDTTAGADAVNGIGQRESATFTGDAYSAVSRLGYYEYGYNPNGELVAGQRRDDSDDPMTGEGFGYEYDPIGNRLEASVDGSPVAEYTPNSHNQYEEIDSTTRVRAIGWQAYSGKGAAFFRRRSDWVR